MLSIRSLSLHMLLGALVLLFSVVRADNSHVVTLTADNFDEIIDGSRPALVEFYAPWCGHCKTLAPIYEELGTAYAHATKDVIIAKVDADDHKSLGSRFGVQGFPTLKWFPKGKASDPEPYEQGRDLDSLVKFVDEKAGLRAKVVKPETFVTTLTSTTFDEVVVKNSDKNVLVAFTAEWCGHCKNLKPIFEKIAKTYKTESNCLVANVDAEKAKDVAERYGVTGYPTLKFFPAKGDPANPEAYNGGRSEADFVAFLNEKCGTERAVGGGLSPKAGRISALDKLANRFVATKDANARLDLVEQTQEALVAHPSKYADYYLKTMKKITGGKEDFPGKEIARLTRIMESGNTDPAKIDSFFVRRNILQAFLAGSSSADEEGDFDLEGGSERAEL
ncbi:hypothetical protein HKX48_009020 [Thoreauomyces humboldtii]|nr:hypothetical protein HKX48_009020 [Thoreauomyces humboldtii]